MMNPLKTLFLPVVAAALTTLGGCATHDGFHDDKEYSNMPWSTPQQWEGSPSIPGLSGPNY